MEIKNYINLHKRQLECFQHVGKGNTVFFGGSRGGGKSHFALCAGVLASMQFNQLKVIVLRRHYDELEQLFITKLQDVCPADVFGYKYFKKEKTAVFHKTKSRIVFRAAKTLDDARKHLGLEYHFGIVDEANQFEQEIVTFLTGSLRNATGNKFNPTLLMTGNPGGISDLWFKSHFISPDYSRWEPEELKYKDSYIYEPSTVYDNPTLMEDTRYIEKLDSLPEHYRRAWLLGDWDVFQGQFFEEWSDKAHVVEPFPIPEDWDRIAGLDIGGTKAHPTVLLKLAQDPETYDVYVYEEYSDYGSIEKYIYYIKEMLLHDDIAMIYADPSAWSTNVKLRETDISPARMFAAEGIPLQRANNDRVNGWRVLKAWLHWTPRRSPKLKIFNTCDGLIKTLPVLKYNPRALKSTEDLDTTMADDYVDALRYALVSGYQFPSKTLLFENEVEQMAQSRNILTPRELVARYRGIENIPYSGKDSPIVQRETESRMSWV